MTLEIVEKSEIGKRLAAGRTSKRQQAQEAQAEQMKALLKSVVEPLSDKIALLEQQIRNAPPPTAALPRTESPEKNLRSITAGMERGEGRERMAVQVLSNPYNTNRRFSSGNIVRLKAGCARDIAYRQGMERLKAPLDPQQPIYGQILQEIRPTASRQGMWKYKVEFKGIGKDGVLEDEIELVQEAVRI